MSQKKVHCLPSMEHKIICSLMTRQKLLQLDWEVLIHCFDYCSFVISSEIQKVYASSFVLFFQALEAILSLFLFFWFHINFRVIYSSLVKNVMHNLLYLKDIDLYCRIAQEENTSQQYTICHYNVTKLKIKNGKQKILREENVIQKSWNEI